MCSCADRLHLPVRAGVQAQRAADQLHRWAPERLHKLCSSPQQDVNAEHCKMNTIRLFMLTFSMRLDNSTVAIQKAATLQCSLTSWWRPWLCIASVELPPTLIGFKAPTFEINSVGIRCCLEYDPFSFCPPLSPCVSCCRCERVWRWPMQREGSLHQLLWFLHLSVSQWLQPGDHAEQEILSRWVSPKDNNGHDFRKTTQTAFCFC